MDADFTQAGPREHLLMALSYYGIAIIADEGQTLRLEKEYEVEIERGFLFKLRWRGEVVAPFDDLNEMCSFIQSPS